MSNKTIITNYIGGDKLVLQATSLANQLLLSAIHQQATDIHFHPLAEKTHIYLRIHGKRHFKQTILPAHYQALLTYFKFTAGMDIGEIRKPQDGTFPFYHSNKHYALRLSTLPLTATESLAIRILPQDDMLPLERLFLFPNQLKQIKQWLTHPAGLILATGPTGSGKSTTLYSLIRSMLQENNYQAITLEDPVEQNVNNLLQVQINEKMGITYQNGLKAVLRHDPDIIMIGEIRDAKTAKFAFSASLTGHLVLSTLHADSALGTIYRLLEMGLSKTDLEQSLIAIAALELIPIEQAQTIKRRAAIAELLDKHTLKKAIKEMRVQYDTHFQSFHHLRKKAYAYGFVPETLFDHHQTK